jgi:hypothetical protein
MFEEIGVDRRYEEYEEEAVRRISALISALDKIH